MFLVNLRSTPASCRKQVEKSVFEYDMHAGEGMQQTAEKQEARRTWCGVGLEIAWQKKHATVRKSADALIVHQHHSGVAVHGHARARSLSVALCVRRCLYLSVCLCESLSLTHSLSLSPPSLPLSLSSLLPPLLPPSLPPSPSLEHMNQAMTQ